MLKFLQRFASQLTNKPPAERATAKKQGDEHVARGEYEQAANCYRRALQWDDRNLSARIGLAFAALEVRQLQEAEYQLRHAVVLGPDVADVHYLLGRLHNERSDRMPERAIEHWTRALALKPDLDAAHRDLYSTLLSLGRRERARDALVRAAASCPGSAEFPIALGNILADERRFGEAIGCYEEAIALEPGSASLHCALADAHRGVGNLDAAASSYRTATALDARLLNAHIGLGMVLDAQGRTDDAITSFSQAVAASPDSAFIHHFLANAYLKRGAKDEAIVHFREVVRLDPQSGTAHLLESLIGENPERASSGYVQALFNEYAEGFDSHLTGVLKYNVPERIAALLGPHAASSGQRWQALDLGCGTGLSGMALAPFVRTLVGVDISDKMLEKARSRGLYERLECRDIVDMMQSEPTTSYDLVVAADVFVYLGRLDDIMEQAARILRNGGLFAFSAASLDALSDAGRDAQATDGYRLRQTGRYAHAGAYLDALATRCGFEILERLDVQGRLDRSRPERHYVCLWRSKR